MERKVEFVACDMPNATPFMLHIYAAVAEQEARAISERTKAAMQAAKVRKKTGRPETGRGAAAGPRGEPEGRRQVRSQRAADHRADQSERREEPPRCSLGAFRSRRADCAGWRVVSGAGRERDAALKTGFQETR
jgi:hypothetical protein